LLDGNTTLVASCLNPRSTTPSKWLFGLRLLICLELTGFFYWFYISSNNFNFLKFASHQNFLLHVILYWCKLAYYAWYYFSYARQNERPPIKRRLFEGWKWIIMAGTWLFYMKIVIDETYWLIIRRGVASRSDLSHLHSLLLLVDHCCGVVKIERRFWIVQLLALFVIQSMGFYYTRILLAEGETIPYFFMPWDSPRSILFGYSVPFISTALYLLFAEFDHRVRWPLVYYLLDVKDKSSASDSSDEHDESERLLKEA